jgi:hypothetical protein
VRNPAESCSVAVAAVLQALRRSHP